METLSKTVVFNFVQTFLNSQETFDYMYGKVLGIFMWFSFFMKNSLYYTEIFISPSDFTRSSPNIGVCRLGSHGPDQRY